MSDSSWKKTAKSCYKMIKKDKKVNKAQIRLLINL